MKCYATIKKNEISPCNNQDQTMYILWFYLLMNMYNTLWIYIIYIYLWLEKDKKPQPGLWTGISLRKLRMWLMRVWFVLHTLWYEIFTVMIYSCVVYIINNQYQNNNKGLSLLRSLEEREGVDSLEGKWEMES